MFKERWEACVEGDEGEGGRGQIVWDLEGCGEEWFLKVNPTPPIQFWS